MPLLETKGAASAQGFGLTLSSGPVTYIEDVFSTYLYTGNGSTQTINNGIDLSGKGGLVWVKSRSNATDHALYDTTRGATKDLVSNSTAAETTQSTGLTAFNGTGFSIGALAKLNTNAATYVSWTFRKQPKFFDLVTYTGNGAAGTRAISHNLGSTPGCIIIKYTGGGASGGYADWYVYHRSLNNNSDNPYFLQLNRTDAQDTGGGVFGTPTSTQFLVRSFSNQNGATYVAYLFAHNAGGFGLTGTDNVISCGSYTGTATTGNAINLGYEAQWVLVKGATNTFNWYCMDNMRGMSQTDTAYLAPNTSDAESTFGSPALFPTATGFQVDSPGAGINQSGATFIYIAIRRGPMKVPTSGTSVFSPIARTPAGATYTASVGFPVDLVIQQQRIVANTVNQANVFDRLRGATKQLATAQTQAEATQSGITNFDSNDGFTAAYGSWSALNWISGYSEVYWNFRRAPGFFDEVCYTGTGSAQTLAHNLGAVPELMIVKWRTGATGDNWNVYHSTLGAGNGLYLNKTDAALGSSLWNNVSPTATQFTVGTQGSVNAATYVAYLFATCAGVSKVGSYTGTGALQTIDCGFTGGARFVLIKRTDSTGDWYVYDSARGISSGNDPYLFLNSTAAEVTGTNYVDTTSVGFQVTAAAPAGLNANGGSFIFFAVA